jgi:hypothetical protein
MSRLNGRQRVAPKTLFARRLVQAMNEAGESAEGLALDEQWSLRLVQKWRAGDNRPSYTNQQRLADRYGKSVAWFYEEPVEAVAS